MFYRKILLASPIVSVASTIAYNNMGPVDGYEAYGTWIGTRHFDFWPCSDSNMEAVRFASSETGTLSKLALGIFGSGVTTNMSLTLLSDADGVMGGTLWNETLNGELPAFGACLYLDVVGGPTLTAGSSYWLLASADSTSMYSWHTNTEGILGDIARSAGWGSWDYIRSVRTRAMRVEVVNGDAPVPVPEPGTLTLLGSGLAMAAALSARRFRR